MSDSKYLALWMGLEPNIKLYISSAWAAAALEIQNCESLQEASEFLLENAKLAALAAGVTSEDFDAKLAAMVKEDTASDA